MNEQSEPVSEVISIKHDYKIDCRKEGSFLHTMRTIEIEAGSERFLLECSSARKGIRVSMLERHDPELSGLYEYIGDLFETEGGGYCAGSVPMPSDFHHIYQLMSLG